MTCLGLYNIMQPTIFMTFQIAKSGLISSTDKLSELSRLSGLPSDSDPLIPLIVPMKANLRPFTINYRVTQDPETLQQVAGMIADRNPNLSEFNPSLAVVVTVEDAVVRFTDVSVSDLHTINMP